MIIKSVKASRIPNRVIIYFDNRTFIPLAIDDVYKLHLSSGMDVSPQFHQDLVDSSFSYLLYNYSLYQIALSPKLARDLILKLKLKFRFYSKKYAFSSPNQLDIINRIITALEAKNLLNETDYVSSVVHRFAHKPTRYILQLLQSKGIKPQQYGQIIDKDDTLLLKKVLTQRKYQNLKTADFNTKRKLIASLLRKGFAYDDIKSEIDYYPSD